MDTVSPQALGSDIEYPLRSNALSAKSILGGRVALTLWDGGLIAEMEREVMEAGAGRSEEPRLNSSHLRISRMPSSA